MENREEHSGLAYITTDSSSPQGKPKVYFCAHKEDFKCYFQKITAEIFAARPECVIFYCPEGDNADFSALRQEVLKEMQLFVMPVSSKLLYTENPALDLEFQLAQEQHIPVLPLMQEPGLEADFNARCGSLMVLDQNAPAANGLSYEEKFRGFLNNILVGDELAAKIRAAFDAYVFLSYRKKDRAYARELMALVHANPNCRDIAIWYDEYLVPGENFNQAIRNALLHCDVFTLLVTPNLVNEPNYVQEHEFPQALEAEKPILPAEAVETDRKQLEEKFSSIPPCINSHDKTALSEALIERLEGIAISENNADPMHNFFIGLAYLNGIDVEKNTDRAVELISFAAEHGVAQASDKLAEMYRDAVGVKQDFSQVIKWRLQSAKLYEEVWEKAQDDDSEYDYYYALCSVSTAYSDLGNMKKDMEYHMKAVELGRLWLNRRPDSVPRQRRLFTGLVVCAKKFTAVGRYSAAEELLKEAEQLTRLIENHAFYQLELFSYSGRLYLAMGQYQKAREQYEKGLGVKTESEDEFSTRMVHSTIYEGLSEICETEGNYEEAVGYAEEALQLCRKIALHEPSPANRGNVVILLIKLGQQYSSLIQQYPNVNKADQVRAYLLEADELSKQVYAELPTAHNLSVYAQVAGTLGIVYQNIDRDYRKALQQFMLYLERLDYLKKAAPLSNQRWNYAQCYCAIADCYTNLELSQEAETYYRKALQIARENYEQVGSFDSGQKLYGILSSLTELLKGQEKLGEKSPEFQAFLDFARENAGHYPGTTTKYQLAYTLYVLSDCCAPESEQQLSLLQEAYKVCGNILKTEDDSDARSLFEYLREKLSDLAQKRGDSEAEHKYLADGRARPQAVLADDQRRALFNTEEFYRETVDINRSICLREPSDSAFRDLSRACRTMSDYYSDRDNSAAAAEYLREAIGALKQVEAKKQGEYALIYRYYINLRTYLMDVERYEEGREAMEQAGVILEQLAPQYSEKVQKQLYRGYYANFGELLNQTGRDEDTIIYWRRAGDVYADLLKRRLDMDSLRDCAYYLGQMLVHRWKNRECTEDLKYIAWLLRCVLSLGEDDEDRHHIALLCAAAIAPYLEEGHDVLEGFSLEDIVSIAVEQGTLYHRRKNTADDLKKLLILYIDFGTKVANANEVLSDRIMTMMIETAEEYCAYDLRDGFSYSCNGRWKHVVLRHGHAALQAAEEMRDYCRSCCTEHPELQDIADMNLETLEMVLELRKLKPIVKLTGKGPYRVKKG